MGEGTGACLSPFFGRAGSPGSSPACLPECLPICYLFPDSDIAGQPLIKMVFARVNYFFSLRAIDQPFRRKFHLEKEEIDDSCQSEVVALRS